MVAAAAFGSPMATPVARIVIGEGASSFEIDVQSSGHVTIRRLDGSSTKQCLPGRTLHCTPDGNTRVEVVRPKYGTTAIVKRATLDIAVEPVPQALASHLGIRENECLLIDIVKGGAADKAGLQKHDILLSVDGKHKLTPKSLVQILAEHKPGDRIDVVILRRGEELRSTVLLGSKTERQQAMFPPIYALPPTQLLVPPQSSTK
ncbi:MAG TPA: PDZ domain-containing protein, partial [Planctomycetota bacterium]|nr:PDZ domain-containing protein [Planctomycetota bacterium]